MGVFKTTRTETRDFNTETAAIRENCVRCNYSKFLRLKAKKKKRWPKYSVILILDYSLQIEQINVCS